MISDIFFEHLISLRCMFQIPLRNTSNVAQRALPPAYQREWVCYNKRLMKRQKTKIKTIWFDLGRVLLNFDFKPAFKYLSRRSPLRTEEMRHYFESHPRLEAELDEGKVPASKLYQRLKKDLRFNGVDYETFKVVWSQIFSEIKPMIALMKRLKKNGYRLIMISNTNRLHYDHIKKRYSVVNYFDKIILSFRVGSRKPKALIYQKALQVSRAKPHEIFYTDDRKKLTTAAAKNHGVHIHTFRKVSMLKRRLKRLGVRCD
jgi:glucose-1-phosphatase